MVRGLLLVVGLMVVTASSASTGSSAQIGHGCNSLQLVAARSLVGKLSRMRNWQASFEQQVILDGRVVNNQRGIIYLKRPGYLRWEIHSPFKQIIWFTPVQTVSYDIELDQAIIKSSKSQLAAGHPMYLLGATEQDILNCKIVKVDKKARVKDSEVYLVYPVESDSYRSAELQYKNDQLIGMEIITADGQLIKLRFHDVNDHPSFTKLLFEFTPKMSTEVLY